MLFGLGMTLTAEEDALLAHITQPCYASFALVNDYFSFDREWGDTQSKPGASKPIINAVWLYMQWRGVSVAVAKRLVAAASNRYEARFLELCERFRNEHKPISPKLDLYLRGLSYQVSGTWFGVSTVRATTPGFGTIRMRVWRIPSRWGCGRRNALLEREMRNRPLSSIVRSFPTLASKSGTRMSDGEGDKEEG